VGVVGLGAALEGCTSEFPACKEPSYVIGYTLP
jgi:hypothetical protein